MRETITRYLEGKISREEEEKLLAFLKEGGDNEALFDQMSREWEDQRCDSTVPDGGYLQLLDAISSRKKASIWKYAVLVAASLALFAIFGIYRYHATAACRDMLSVSVPMGTRTSLILPDGSKVWVNSGSTLTYPREFKKHKRVVILQGEGYFEVEANPKCPFVVEAGDCRFTVFGTKFNINAYKEEQKVSAVLMEGKLGFKSDSFDYIMSEGELVSYGAGGASREKVDAWQYQGWTEQKICFDEIALPELLRRVARELDTRISLDTDKFNDREIRASFSKEYDVERILSAISFFLPISYRQTEDGVWHITN